MTDHTAPPRTEREQLRAFAAPFPRPHDRDVAGVQVPERLADFLEALGDIDPERLRRWVRGSGGGLR